MLFKRVHGNGFPLEILGAFDDGIFRHDDRMRLIGAADVGRAPGDQFEIKPSANA